MKNVIPFLQDLTKNNNREWFNDNKNRYLLAKDEFEAFIIDLLPRMAGVDKELSGLEPKQCIFRIYRDVRFSKDKSPYKTNFGAHLVATHERPHDRAGYYIHLEPGASFLAGGAYLPPGPWLNAIRASIDTNGKELITILKKASFKKKCPPRTTFSEGSNWSSMLVEFPKSQRSSVQILANTASDNVLVRSA